MRRLLLACFAVALVAWNTPLPAADAGAAAAPDAAQLVALSWRLFSPVFPMMPADGYPTAFDANGSVTTANLAGVTRWTLAAETLDLLGADGRSLYRFNWSGSVDAFVHRIPGGAAAGLNMVIGRTGMRPEDIDAAMATGASRDIRMLRDLAEPGAPLVLPGAAISTEGEARRIAVEAYFRAFGLRALQSARVVGVVRLGFAMDGFAQRGDQVWEVRIHETGEVSAVIWVHAGSGAPRFLAPRVD